MSKLLSLIGPKWLPYSFAGGFAGYTIYIIHKKLQDFGFTSGGGGSSPNTDDVPLEPAPEAFDFDSTATTIFKQLAQYKYLNVKAYEHALLNTDALLFMEMQLVNGAAQPKFRDVPQSHTFAALGLTNFKTLIKSAQDGKTIVELENLYRDYHTFIFHHLQNLYGLLERVKQ